MGCYKSSCRWPSVLIVNHTMNTLRYDGAWTFRPLYLWWRILNPILDLKVSQWRDVWAMWCFGLTKGFSGSFWDSLTIVNYDSLASTTFSSSPQKRMFLFLAMLHRWKKAALLVHLMSVLPLPHNVCCLMTEHGQHIVTVHWGSEMRPQPLRNK